MMRVPRLFRCAALMLIAACGNACANELKPDELTYKSWFRAKLDPSTGSASAYIRIEQDQHQVKRLTLRMPKSRYTVTSADGRWRRQGDQVVWQVPKAGGRLRYEHPLLSKRDNGAFDGQLGEDGGLFRGDDLFPPAAVLTEDDAVSISRVRIDVPPEWTVHTQYGRANNRSRRVVNPERRFDRPTGWMIAGRLGVRIDEIAERRIVTAGFVGERMRRNDILAFMRWNLPELIRVTGRFPPRLLIVGADDPYWRGGLSASRSFYLHVDRPMISANGTSTLLHELTHIATGLRAAGDDDWIVEGLAEYYSMEIMRRTDTISPKRFDDAIAGLKRWSADVTRIATDRSAGKVTAKAAVVFNDLARELRQDYGQEDGLDGIMRALSATTEPVTFAQLRKLLQDLGASESKALAQFALLVGDESRAGD